MCQNKEVNQYMGLNKESIKIGFAYVGIVVGAGFSTGQEVRNSSRLMVYGHILAC